MLRCLNEAAEQEKFNIKYKEAVSVVQQYVSNARGWHFGRQDFSNQIHQIPVLHRVP